MNKNKTMTNIAKARVFLALEDKQSNYFASDTEFQRLEAMLKGIIKEIVTIEDHTEFISELLRLQTVRS